PASPCARDLCWSTYPLTGSGQDALPLSIYRALPTNSTEEPKKKGRKMDVICVNLLKTYVEKMSLFRLSTIFMKTNELSQSFHDVDEKKGSSSKKSGE
ncbi:MAG: hypothetical protein ABSF45_31240, partial [Terriglobia bacterium]